MAGWGAGQQILIGTASWTEARPYPGSVYVEWRRRVTDTRELWTGMDYTNAETKRTTLIGTTGYTSANRDYVGGGQHVVTAVKRTFGNWALALVT
jgi:hypothetical protein